MSFDWSLIWDNIPILLQGAVITIQITVMAVGCGFFIGMIAALANLSRFKIVRLLVNATLNCSVAHRYWFRFL